jgi:uncharacterized protein (DUF885 family)
MPICLVAALTGLVAATPPGWVERSNENARVLLEVFARLQPEAAAQFGVEAVDEQITDLTPGYFERMQAAIRQAQAALEPRLAPETNPAVRQDLQILLRESRDALEGNELNRRYQAPYRDVPLTMFQGIRSLLDDQVAPERRAKALVRLRRYAGAEPGYTPFTVLARDRLRDSLANPALAGPFRDEVEKNLANSARYVEGIKKLFQKFPVAGYEAPLAQLEQQVAEYEAFLRKEVLPRARADFRLPPPLYAFRLRQFGVEIAPEDLAQRARIAFMEIRNEMRALAPLVAKEKSLPATDYRDVIRALKKDQLVGEAILPHYQKRMRELEEIIRRERVVTLPQREARIRLASEAESAAVPAPNMRPPRLVGNTGEMGEFVLPLRVPTAAAAASGAQAMQSFDDFTFGAASWTLTVHEGRPGHELQFASVVEKGVSMARALFAFNSVNVEGWALYMESEMKPYLPLDGQLVSLQHRLLRAARAFLDPELQAEKVTPDRALRLLMDEVVLSEPMARQEVERYTFRAPGQATSYFYGYTRWLELKSRAELALAERFDRQRYHDFLLSQGFLPPDALAEAVAKDFVPAEQARARGAGPAAQGSH